MKDLAVTGRDVMDTLGLKPGPRVGDILAGVLDYVLDDPSRNTKGRLIARIRQMYP